MGVVSIKRDIRFPVHFWYFWLTIHNTANFHVSNAFDLLAVFISFPLVRAAARPLTLPRPFFWGREVPKKKIACCVEGGRLDKLASALAVGHVCVSVGVVTAAFCFTEGFGVFMGSLR